MNGISAHARRDLVGGALLLAFGIFVLVNAFSYQIGTARRMGPGYFPAMLSGLMVILASSLVVNGIARARADLQQSGATGAIPDPDPARPSLARSVLLVLAVVGSASLFTLLLHQIGLPLAVALTVLVAGEGGTASWLRIASLAAGMAIGCTVVFIYLLGQQLPVLGSWFGG